MQELAGRFRIDLNRRDRSLTRAELARGLGSADGIVTMLSDRIDRMLIAHAPHLKIIANYAVGFNNIDLAAATERRIAVTNTPGVLTESTADLTWALILATARRLPEGERLVRSRRWTGWAPTQLLGCDIFGRTLGIVGMGRIGQAVARRAAGFQMRILYFSRRPLPYALERRLGAEFVPLPRLLRGSDFVSLHLPLTPASHHLVDGHALDLMRPGAFLINTARGAIVDEPALARALVERRIGLCPPFRGLWRPLGDHG